MITLNCLRCGISFKIKPYRSKDRVAKYCSYKCKNKPRDLIIENNYAFVPLTRNQFAVIDLIDFKEISKHNWQARWNPTSKTYYAVTTINNKTVRLHRFILKPFNLKFDIDHLDHNGLNCRRNNLRICSRTQNLGNQRLHSKKTSSRFKGVCFDKRRSKWMAYINAYNNRIYLGYYNDEKHAACAYNVKAQELFGEFAYLNKVEMV